jgi:hypothetical protein
VLLDIGDVRRVDRHSRAIVPYRAVEQTGIVLAELLVDSVRDSPPTNWTMVGTEPPSRKVRSDRAAPFSRIWPKARLEALPASGFPPSARRSVGVAWGLEVPGSNPGAPTE